MDFKGTHPFDFNDPRRVPRVPTRRDVSPMDPFRQISHPEKKVKERSILRFMLCVAM